MQQHRAGIRGTLEITQGDVFRVARAIKVEGDQAAEPRAAQFVIRAQRLTHHGIDHGTEIGSGLAIITAAAIADAIAAATFAGRQAVCVIAGTRRRG